MNKIVHQKDFIEIITKIVARERDLNEEKYVELKEELSSEINEAIASITIKDGEPGKDGKDSKPEDVAKIILKDKAFLEKIEELKGEPGNDGEPGKDGLDSDPHKVAGILLNSSYFLDNIRGANGKDSKPEDVAKHLLLNEEFISACKGKDAEPTKEVSPSEVAEILLKNEVFVSACKGKDAEPVKTDQILKIVEGVLNNEEYKAALKGDPGKDAEEVDLEQLYEFALGGIKDLVFKNKEEFVGDKGEPGKDADNFAIMKLLRENAEFIQAVKGKDGKDADVEEVVKSLSENEDFINKISGEDGMDSEPEEVASILLNDKTFMDSIKGEPGEKGKDAKTADIVDSLLGNVDFMKSVKGSTGDKGDKGDKGDPGLDRPMFDLANISKDSKFDKNTIGIWGGGIHQALRKTHGNPAQDPNGWRLLINSIYDVELEKEYSKRKNIIKFKMLDGEEHSVAFDDSHRFVYSRESMKIPGDFLFEGTNYVVFDGKEILSVDLKGDVGEKGQRGPKGRAGKTGIGITNLYEKDYEEGDDGRYLIVELSNGEVKHFMLELFSESEEIDQEIKRFAGVWNVKKKYKKGDLVKSSASFYLAISDTEKELKSEDWLFMFGQESNREIGNASMQSNKLVEPAGTIDAGLF